jgi:hypothetical protein
VEDQSKESLQHRSMQRADNAVFQEHSMKLDKHLELAVKKSAALTVSWYVNSK